jgi:hypothetical protein
MSSELAINNLIYQAPDVSCAARNTKRTQIFAFPNTYPECTGGEVIPILFNTGGAYIDATKSSIQFKLQVNSPPNVLEFFAFDIDGASTINTGSTVLNLISQVIHETKDGQLLYKEYYKNMMQTIREYKISLETKDSLAIFGGYIDNDEYQWYPAGETVSFNLPLSMISPLFNTSSILPYQLISGSKLTLVVANPLLNIVGIKNRNYVALPPGLTVSFVDIAVNLHQIELHDGIQAVIKSSALNLNKGLQFPYYCFHNSKYTPESSSFTYNIQLAASKVSYVAIKFFRRDRSADQPKESPIRAANIYQLNKNQNGNDDNGLGFSIRAKLGEQYYPVYNITTATEAYTQTVQALNPISYSDTEDVDPLKVINKLQSGCVPYFNYCNTIINPGVYLPGDTSGGTIFAISLEKSNNVGLTGEKTTASRVISVEIEGMPAYDEFDMYTQVQYLAVASIFENNVVISK